MSYSIAAVSEDEIPLVVDIIYGAYTRRGANEFLESQYPRIDTAQGRSNMCERLRLTAKKLSDPQCFLKVTDDSDGEMVAWSLRSSHSTPPRMLSDLSGDFWDTEDDRNYANHLRRERNNLVLRTFAQLDGPVTEIFGFYVEHTQHGKGIGSQMMKHIVGEEKEARAFVVIAHPNAVGFYQKQGFVVVEDAILPLKSPWESKPRSRLVSMVYKR